MTKTVPGPIASEAIAGPSMRERHKRRQSVTEVERVRSGGEPRDIYHSLVSMSWLEFFGFVVLWYLFVNVVFALGYMASGADAFEGLQTSGGLKYALECFFFSVQTFATIGYGHISPRGVLPNILVTFEALSGLLSISVATGLLYGRFSKPTARILFSDVAVINQIDGVPCLLVRIANERRNVIASAEVNATLLIVETTAEGEVYRNFHDLSLERSSTPMFALSWTIVHAIDEKSPLYGLNRQMLKDLQALLLITVAGVDDTLVQPIHARFSYAPDEILWDKRYVDILVREPDGRLLLHLERMHDVVDARKPSRALA